MSREIGRLAGRRLDPIPAGDFPRCTHHFALHLRPSLLGLQLEFLVPGYRIRIISGRIALAHHSDEPIPGRFAR
jgi:hypothetical protein